MKLLKTITDKDILGTGGLSNAKPRITARAIMKNGSSLYAVMYSEEFDLYTLPGGGVEEGEDILQALRREILEETGCECSNIEPLGYVEENRAHSDYTQISYYFLVSTDSQQLIPNLTEDEKTHGTAAGWHTLEDAYRRIAEPRHPTAQRKYLQARDVAALEEYKSRHISRI